MIYAEAAYFDGNHCAHVAARDEVLRLKRIADRARRDRRRRGGHAVAARQGTWAR